MIIAELLQLERDEGTRGTREDVTFFSEESNKEPVCDVIIYWMKTGSGPGHLYAPVAGESLNRPDESKLSSVRFLLSPLVVLRTPIGEK